MNEQAYIDIKTLLDNKNISYRAFEHAECRTSEESAKVRTEAGFPDAIGAKAILCKVTFRSDGDKFVLFVLPGTHVIDKAKLKQGLPDLKQFRFATPEELLDIAGVVPGCMPPFGGQIFPKIEKTYVSSLLKDYERVAFNAAKLNASIILYASEYFKVIEPDQILDFSKPKD